MQGMDEDNSSFIDIESVGMMKVLGKITTARPKVKCEHCGYASHSPEHVRSHLLNNHFCVTIHKCPHKLCKRKFALRGSLRKHERQVHKQDAKKSNMHVCGICKYETSSQIEFLRHENFTHNKNLMWTCSVCPFATDQEEELQTHVKTNHESQCFVCGICRRKYDSAAKVKCHAIRTHFQNFKFGKRRGRKRKR